jgi:hypothetical protein
MPVIRMSLPDFERWLLRLAPNTERAVIRGLQAGAMRVKVEVVREINRQGLVDIGDLRNSVNLTHHTDGATVSVDSPHAAPLEYGARPFYPPLAPLAAWALRKGLASDEKQAMGIARGIAGKFATQGFPPRAFFRTAVQTAMPAVRAEINRACTAVGWRATLSSRRVLRSLGM